MGLVVRVVAGVGISRVYIEIIEALRTRAWLRVLTPAQRSQHAHMCTWRPTCAHTPHDTWIGHERAD
jgi:hypothetical protein